MPDQDKAQVFFAELPGDVVVIRVEGRGNFELSPQLKRLFDRYNKPDYSPQYVLDLEACPTLDSTFMGTIAAMAMHQKQCREEKAIALNLHPTAKTQMEKLGLMYLLDLHASEKISRDVHSSDFRQVENAEGMSKCDKVVHMLESHQALVEADSGNEVKFRNVLEMLSASLDEEGED